MPTETEPAGPSPAGLIRSVVGPPQGRWGQRIATATAAVTAGKAVWQTYRNRRDAHVYTVAIEDTDSLYAPVQAWVLARMPEADKKALVAHTARMDRVMETDAHQPQTPLRMFYDGSRMQTLIISGHPVMVGIERESNSGIGSDHILKWRPDRIVFYAKTMAGRDAVTDFLGEIASQLTSDNTPRLLTASRWGDWHSNRSIMPRPLESVVLRAGLMEDLVEDLEKFYSHEADYVRLGIPWHRGYLFHGPPGTGKTSAAKAVAAHLGLDMYYVPLADIRTDTDLDRLVAGVEPHSVLLLEDVDVLAVSHQRQDDDSGEPQGLTLTGLLNALDGVVTPHGLVTIMTTNRLDVLDSALTRRGRADRVEEMGYLDPDQWCRLVASMTDLSPAWPWADLAKLDKMQLTAAEVVEVVKRHIGDPGAAVDELQRFLEDIDPSDPIWRS